MSLGLLALCPVHLSVFGALAAVKPFTCLHITYLPHFSAPFTYWEGHLSLVLTSMACGLLRQKTPADPISIHRLLYV